MVPMLVSVGDFSVHHAIPLTQATVFGASFMNLLHNVSKRHPDFDRPLIDYHTALMLEVTTLLGTVLGVDLNSLSPVWCITILLILTLSFTTYRTMKKGLELRRKESESNSGGTGDGVSNAKAKSGEREIAVGDADAGDFELDELDESQVVNACMHACLRSHACTHAHGCHSSSCNPTQTLKIPLPHTPHS